MVSYADENLEKHRINHSSSYESHETGISDSNMASQPVPDPQSAGRTSRVGLSE